MCGKVSELKTLNETLHKENIAQDRELRKLRKEIHQLEQMINNLKSEISLSKYCTPNVPKKDAEVMAGMCCTGAECGDWEPVKDFNSVLREEMVSYQERMQKFDLKDVDLKPSGNDVRALRKANLALREQLHSVCTVCAALSEQCRAAVLRGQLKDDIIREMRRQLKHAKAKWNTSDVSTSSANVKTSTPNVSCARNVVEFGQSPEVSIIEPPVQAPIVIPSDTEEVIVNCTESSANELAPRKHVRECTPQQPKPICASKCKHVALCPKAQSPDKSAFRCKHILDCAQELIGVCALQCKHVTNCDLCRCTSKFKHASQCTSNEALATCALKSKVAKDRTQNQPIASSSCAMRCSHVPECSPGQAIGTCALKSIHAPDCAQAQKRETCTSICKHASGSNQGGSSSECEHVEDFTKSRAITSCALYCSHVPECTPGQDIGLCALKCIHVQGCSQGQGATCTSKCKYASDYTKCERGIRASKCTHVPNCTNIERCICLSKCKHVPDCTKSTCASTCKHVPDCTKIERCICVSKCKHFPECTKSTCASKCKHVPDCSKIGRCICASKCKHVPECTKIEKDTICASKCKHVPDCSKIEKDTCASKCKHVPDCTKIEKDTICASKCKHVSDCTKIEKDTCASKYKHVPDCTKIEKDTCASKCKHVPDCTKIEKDTICASKCKHVSDCTKIEKDTCASKCKHVPDCSKIEKDTCASKCKHVPDCTKIEKGTYTSKWKHIVLDCAYRPPVGSSLKCIHVKDCAETQSNATCSLNSKHVDTHVSTDELPGCDEFGASTSSGLGNKLAQKCSRALESLSAITLRQSCPKIKTELRSVSFDMEAKESVGTSSAADSPTGSCASARAQYYQSKLLATLQILQNKEETVRVQAESLAVAESRIACLTARGTELKRELERKGRELQTLQNTLEESRREQTDVSTTAHHQEMENQENVVNTLQNNLNVIEDLYRECFHETVKQDNLIDMLRKSYLDVRLMDKEKSYQITKLHNVINKQKWSLDKCEDIALEVDNLKSEISEFLNSSNNDSGMWEETIGLNEDLQDIAAQLLRLRELLKGDCTCGLEEENSRLKQDNDVLEIEIGDLRIRITELEVNLVNMEKLKKRYEEQIQNKDKELNSIRGQLASLEDQCGEIRSSNDKLTSQLTRTQALLDDKCSELSNVHRQCEDYGETIRTMKEELDKTTQISKENQSLRDELCATSRRASRLQRQAESLKEELTCARAHCEYIEAGYRQKVTSAAELESQLDEAHGRGAQLCGEARRVVQAVRGWVRHMKEIQREQEEQMKRKECEVRCLQQRLEERQNLPMTMCQSEKYCSPRPSTNTLTRERRRRVTLTSSSEIEPTCSKLLQRNEGSYGTTCECVGERQEPTPCTSASEMGSCTSTPVPPKRTLKKKPPCVIKVQRRYGWWGPLTKHQCEASVQRPVRCDAATSGDVTRVSHACPAGRGSGRAVEMRPLSPGEEMFSRIESMSASLADGYRRWTQHKRDKR